MEQETGIRSLYDEFFWGYRAGLSVFYAELMLYRLEAGRFASRLKVRLPDEQRPSTPHAFLVGGLPLARRLLTMPPSRLR